MRFGSRRQWQSIATGLLLFSFNACNEASPSDSEEVGGALVAVEFARVGSMDDPGTSFGSVDDVLPLESGLLILDRGGPRIARFDSDYRWIEDFGRAGDGPGELNQPVRLGRTGTDLWVQDQFGRRLEGYHVDGTPKWSFRHPVAPDSAAIPMIGLGLLQDGTVLAGPGPRSVSAQQSGRIRFVEVARVHQSGEKIETLYRGGLVADDAYVTELPGGGMMMGMHPHRQSPLVRVFPDGSGFVAVERFASQTGAESSYRILVRGVDGTVQMDHQEPYVPVPADGWMDAFLAEVAEEGDDGAAQARLHAMQEGLAPRPYYPPVSDLVAGMDGTIWIKREPHGQTEAAWDVFTRSGDRLGTLLLPAGVTILYASRDEVWARITDDYDVPYAVGYRIREDQHKE